MISSLPVPRARDIESLRRWMMATKPLIKCESEFPDFAHDFVAVNNLKENGALEEFLEGFVTKFGLGLKVGRQKTSLNSHLF
jgi:hypothetical protein